MKIKELTLTAVIPTGQYANLQPSVTVEVDGDYDEARQTALDHIAQFSEQFAEEGKAISNGQPKTVKAKKLTPYIGEGDVYFDADSHTYYDKDGQVFLSASQFAEQYGHPFDAASIVPRYAAKFEVEPQTIIDFWQAKADASTTFGTALHQALETYGKYKKLTETLSTSDKTVELGIHPSLLPIVEMFFKDREKENAVYEPFVVDFGNKKCGQIDRLVILDEEKKICRVEDYKTNADLYKQNSPKNLKKPFDNLPNQPISLYTLQLNFYNSILEANGWTVEHPVIHHWAGKQWVSSQVPKIKI